MNSAQTYKSVIRKKETYLISTLVAVALSMLLGLSVLGVYEGHIEEERAEQRLLSHVPYAEHFMTYAPEVGWDWEMLAAVAYHESRYNPSVVSPGGARGLMQLMPKTGKRFGLNDSTFFVPQDNIAASVKYIARLQHQFRHIRDTTEQTKFVLASYNAGPAHIHDARRLAKKYGKNGNRWQDTEYFLEQLKYEEYYTDSVVQYGSFGATETVRYVRGVLKTYNKLKAENEQTNPQ